MSRFNDDRRPLRPLNLTLTAICRNAAVYRQDVRGVLFLKPLYVLLALIALQLFAYTGVFLMIIGGGLITGVVVHVVLVFMALDVALRRATPMLLLVPALFYGGYYLACFMQQREIARAATELASTNPGRVLSFDPNVDSLVMTGAGAFVSTHEIPVAYEESKYLEPQGYAASRLIPRDQCDAVRKDTRRRIQTLGVQPYRVFVKDACQLVLPEAPPGRVISVTVSPEPNDGRMKPGVNIRTTTIMADGKTLGSFRTGSIMRLPAFPWIYAGCALNSAVPKWQCDAAFMSARLEIDGTPEGVDRAVYDTPVAVMLGIRKYPPGALKGFRGYPQNADILQAVERERASVENQDFAELETILSGGRVERPGNLGWALAQNPKRLEPYAERMAQRFAELESAAVEPPPGSRDRRLRRSPEARPLAAALAALPPERFAAVAERMFALAQRPRFWADHAALYLRAADAGPQTLAFYKAEFLERRVEEPYDGLPVLALCRIGSADADLVSEMKARYPLDGKKRRRGQRQEALFLTLLKFGEADFLRANDLAAPARDKTWREAVLAGKGRTATGPNNCMTEAWAGDGKPPRIMAASLIRTRNGWEAAAE